MLRAAATSDAEPLLVMRMVRSRSSGAVALRDTDPAKPPATRRWKGWFGGVMHSLRVELRSEHV